MLVLTVLSVFSFATLESLVVKADAAKTARNTADHELLFRISACSFVIVAVLDVVVAWALYAVLRPVNRSIALLAAWLRVAYVAVFAAAVSNLFAAVRLLTDGNSRDAFGPRQLNAQVMTSVNAFQDGWNVALVIFGLRLLVLGYLVFQSSYIPRVLGILLGIASLGYLIDSFGGFLSKSYAANVGVVTFAGEAPFMGWLLWRGRRLQESAIPVRSSAIAPYAQHDG